MVKPNTLFIGLDVHKETTDVALVSDSLDDTVRYYGTLATSLPSFDRLLKKLTPKANSVVVVYEAGPCGFWLHRHLEKRGAYLAGS